MMMGNHRMSCTFTMQQIGTLHTPKRIPTFMAIALLSAGSISQHLNPPSAVSDHCESVAWFINNGPHSAACCYKLGPNGVKGFAFRRITGFTP